MPRTRARGGSRWLRRNHGHMTPQTWIFLDVLPVAAPDPENRDREWWRMAYGCAEYMRWDRHKPTRVSRVFFSEPEQFWTWLYARLSDRRSCWICGYGVAQALTMLHFWDKVDAREFELRRRAPTVQTGDTQKETRTWDDDYLLVTKDPPTIVMAARGKSLVHIVDTRNYFDAEVPQLGEWAGNPVPDKPVRGAPTPQWENYLRQRVKAVTAAMGKLTEWWSKNDMGVWRYTASSLAMAYFRHKHYSQPILLDDCEPARKLSRQALVGGECRCFFVGETLPWIEHSARQQEGKKRGKVRSIEGPIYLYDVNSLYPFVMWEELFPRELLAWKEPGSFDDLTAWRGKLMLIANVTLSTWNIPYPVQHDGERWFALGEFNTALAGPELFDALDRGLVTHVHEIAAYLPGRLFSSYVDALYPQKVAARKAGNHLEAEFHKSLLNNLAGKFSQRGPEWEWSDMPTPGPRWGPIRRVVNGTPDPKLYRVISGYVEQQSDLVDSLESLPAITAFVNSYARMYMRSVRWAIGEENIVYQDTDSLHVTEEGQRRLLAKGYVSEDELGKFSLRTTIHHGSYRGVKNYTMNGEHVVAGRKQRLLECTDKVYVQEEAESFNAIIMRKPNGIICVRRVSKSMTTLNPRGIVHPDGRVSPAKLLAGVLHLKDQPRRSATS